MPLLSTFYGIKITMNFDDHNPPHFHVNYNGRKAIVDINQHRIIDGFLPAKQLSMVVAWSYLHQEELLNAWENARNNKHFDRIAPLQ